LVLSGWKGRFARWNSSLVQRGNPATTKAVSLSSRTWKDKERRAIEIEARDADEAKIETKNVISPSRTISEYRNVTCNVHIKLLYALYYMLFMYVIVLPMLLYIKKFDIITLEYSLFLNICVRYYIVLLSPILHEKNDFADLKCCWIWK